MPDRAHDRPVFYGQNNAEITESKFINPKHLSYTCGACGKTTAGRVVCDLVRGSDRALVRWCLCSCGKFEPTIVVTKGSEVLVQLPVQSEFRSDESWPPDLARLFDEAAKAYSANAFTASSMACRKVLMSCACHEGAEDGKAFTYYVDFIIEKVLTYPRAKEAIDVIRTIGNDANHDVTFVGIDEARRSMQIVTYMLNTIYSFPKA